MAKIWKWHGVSKDGKPSPRSPYVSRGPATEEEMKVAGQRLLNSMRQDHFDAHKVDPGWNVGTVEEQGEDNGEQPGQWRPVGSQPIKEVIDDTLADDASGASAHGLVAKSASAVPVVKK